MESGVVDLLEFPFYLSGDALYIQMSCFGECFRLSMA